MDCCSWTAAHGLLVMDCWSWTAADGAPLLAHLLDDAGRACQSRSSGIVATRFRRDLAWSEAASAPSSPSAAACYRRCVEIAVVIPALDEAHDIAAAVRSASVPGAEVVVVDGGSRDETAERARAAGARVVGCGPGRARQLRKGVEATTREVVLFLHADTRLPAGWDRAVARALGKPTVAGGAFRLRFDERRVGLRILEWGVRLRVALFALPYGDQAIFVRRDVLDAVGGVPLVSFMEDLDLVRAVKTRGRVVALPLPVTFDASRCTRRNTRRREAQGSAMRT